LVSVAAIGGFLFGYDTGIIAGAQIWFKNDFPTITTTQTSLVVSLALVGAAIGALFAGILSDKIGRKKVIIVADVAFTLGALC
jgi:MFS family permease